MMCSDSDALMTLMYVMGLKQKLTLNQLHSLNLCLSKYQRGAQGVNRWIGPLNDLSTFKSNLNDFWNPSEVKKVGRTNMAGYWAKYTIGWGNFTRESCTY